MPQKQLRRLERRLTALRGGPRKARELERLAKTLGRKRAKRGKEPTWISVPFPELPPVSIPHHSRDVKRGTAEEILSQLERGDITMWERRITTQGASHDKKQSEEPGE